MTQQKQCTKCLQLLDLTFFSPNKKLKDGFTYWCKPCFNLYRKFKSKKKRITSPEDNKKNYLKHKEKRLLAFQEYYQSNKQKIKQKQKEYRQSNKEYLNLRNRKRKELITGRNITSQQIEQLKFESKGKCHYCQSTEFLQIDHYFPLSKGGAHHISNLVIACRHCNLSKKDKDPEEWLKKINKK